MDRPPSPPFTSRQSLKLSAAQEIQVDKVLTGYSIRLQHQQLPETQVHRKRTVRRGSQPSETSNPHGPQDSFSLKFRRREGRFHNSFDLRARKFLLITLILPANQFPLNHRALSMKELKGKRSSLLYVSEGPCSQPLTVYPT